MINFDVFEIDLCGNTGSISARSTEGFEDIANPSTQFVTCILLFSHLSSLNFTCLNFSHQLFTCLK